MGFKNKLFKTRLKGLVLTQKAKYIIGVVVLVAVLIGGGILWYVEERANKPGEATGIENETDDDGGLQVGESDAQEDFEDFEDDFIDVTELDDDTDKKDDTKSEDKKDENNGTLKEDDDKKDEGTSSSTDSGWGRLF